VTPTLVSLSEYLATIYRPDCEYVDGELLERNVGEWDHSRLQALLSGYLLRRGAFVYSPGKVEEVIDGVLRAHGPDIAVPFSELENL
jgi:hypothetical protein